MVRRSRRALLAAAAALVSPAFGRLPAAAAATGAAATGAASGSTPVAGTRSAGPTAAGKPLPIPPESLLLPFRVHYGDYRRGVVVANVDYRLSHDGKHYELRGEGRAAGVIALIYSGVLTQVSTGQLGPQGFRPIAYSERRGKRPERKLRFDYAGGRMHGSGSAPPVPLVPGTQDRLSVFFQLGLLARAYPERFADGAHYELPVASMDEVEPARFAVVGRETIEHASGGLRTLHLRRAGNPAAGETKVDLWLGYDSGMLPVRVRMEDANGHVLDQLVQQGV